MENDNKTGGSTPHFDSSTSGGQPVTAPSVGATTSPSTSMGHDDKTLKEKATEKAHAAKETATAKFGELKTTAGEYAGDARVKAKDGANAGLAKAATAVGGFAKMIEDAAPTVDDKLGSQYGDYARSAAQSVSGFANSLETKDVDMLIADGKEFVKKNPAAAVGIAAVAGFVLSRMFRGGGHSDA